MAQHSRRDTIKGRNMGGMIAGIRKGIEKIDAQKLEIEIKDWSQEEIRKFRERLENVSFERKGASEG